MTKLGIWRQTCENHAYHACNDVQDTFDEACQLLHAGNLEKVKFPSHQNSLCHIIRHVVYTNVINMSQLHTYLIRNNTCLLFLLVCVKWKLLAWMILTWICLLECYWMTPVQHFLQTERSEGWTINLLDLLFSQVFIHITLWPNFILKSISIYSLNSPSGMNKVPSYFMLCWEC